MVWNSILMMTIFDLVIILFVLFTGYVLFVRRYSIDYLEAKRAALSIAMGLGVIGLFYFADLVTMHIFPLFMPMKEAMEIMRQLHLNYLWFVMVGGISMLVFGVLCLVYRVFPSHISTLEGLRDAHQYMSRLATTDPLTGLANRRMFLEEMELLLSHPNPGRRVAALLFLDLDGFKPINDTHGHDAGDEVLKIIGQRIETHIRRSDTLARYGGDEFVVCLKGIDDKKQIRQIAEHLAQAISEPINLEENNHILGVSIGIALSPQNGEKVETLLGRADMAMYMVKKAGGQDIAFYDDVSVSQEQGAVNVPPDESAHA
jgi:diguanylate cyclase (GGDEF)-like protein